MKKIHIFGGGFSEVIANHLSLSALAYGTVAKQLSGLCAGKFTEMDVVTHLSKMAGGTLETMKELEVEVARVVADLDTKIVFFTAAIPDYSVLGHSTFDQFERGECNRIPTEPKHRRFETRENSEFYLICNARKKLLENIRKERKDIFLVGFKTTAGKSDQQMFEAGLRQCKESSVNLCFVNDVVSRKQMIVTPEEATYAKDGSRGEALVELVDIAWHRSQLTFTQSTVISGQPVPWESEGIPAALRTAVNHCIAQGAYKVFQGATVGHFACKIADNEFLTSIRKSNFNDLHKLGLVKIVTDGPDTVLAFGKKPSVGGQSQRMVFADHEGYDCIVHFHCPLLATPKDEIPSVSQREYECGSHQCGQRTSANLKEFPDYGRLKAVYLENHGPNIVFDSRTVTGEKVIEFITNNFALDQKTGGFTLPLV